LKIQKFAETLTYLSEEVGLGVGVETTTYAFLSLHQDAGQNYDLEKLKKII
jgi:hypothetical protein